MPKITIKLKQMKKLLLLFVTLLASLSAWAATPGEIGTPVVTLTQNAEDNTKLDVAITCENARGILFTFNGDEPTLNSPSFEGSYQIDLTQVPSPVTVKAVGYDAEYNLGEVGSASFTLDPIEINFSYHTCWFRESIDVTVTVSGAIGVPRVTYKVNDEPVQNATGEFTFTETSTLEVEVEDDRAGGEVVTSSETYMLEIAEYGNITFGNGGANTKINRTEVTGTDDLGNEWTITTVFAGNSTYFNNQSSQFSQVGSSSIPAESITFTMTLPEVVKVTSFQAKFGGTSGDTKGKISLMVDNTMVGYDELDGPTSWDVVSTQAAIGKTLTITVTDIESGVQVYDISYAYEPISPETVSYIDENRETQSHEAIVLTGNETSLGEDGQESWYVAIGTLNYTETLNIAGDVHLILADGAVMNIGTEASPVSGVGIDGSEYYSDLTIYGQSLDDDTAGHLNINTDEECIYFAGDYAQYSGNVTANSSNGCGVVPWYNFAFTGGTLYVTAKSNAIYPDDNVDILGGKLSAVCVGNYYGIYSLKGVVTFGWKSLDDEFTVSKFAATVKIVDGQAFTDGENIYDSTTPSETFWALTNVTLRPVVKLEGVQFADNHYATWYGDQNLAVPEGLEAYVVTAVVSDKAVVEPVSYIPAGVGVLLYSATPKENIIANAYTGSTETVTSMLVGSLESQTVNDGYLLYNDSFVRAQSGTTIAPHRCYLSLDNEQSAPLLLRIVTPGVVTAIENLTVPESSSGQRYNILGQPVGPDYRGIVIQNGKKVIVR